MQLASELASLFMTSQVNIVNGQPGSIQGESERDAVVEGKLEDTHTHKDTYVFVER